LKKRLDFVAVTRAKEKLYIITDKAPNYLTPDIDLKEQEELEQKPKDYQDLNKKAFSLFLGKDYENAKKQLEK